MSDDPAGAETPAKQFGLVMMTRTSLIAVLSMLLQLFSPSTMAKSDSLGELILTKSEAKRYQANALDESFWRTYSEFCSKNESANGLSNYRNYENYALLGCKTGVESSELEGQRVYELSWLNLHRGQIFSNVFWADYIVDFFTECFGIDITDYVAVKLIKLESPSSALEFFGSADSCGVLIMTERGIFLGSDEKPKKRKDKPIFLPYSHLPFVSFSQTNSWSSGIKICSRRSKENCTKKFKHYVNRDELPSMHLFSEVLKVAVTKELTDLALDHANKMETLSSTPSIVAYLESSLQSFADITAKKEHFRSALKAGSSIGRFDMCTDYIESDNNLAKYAAITAFEKKDGPLLKLCGLKNPEIKCLEPIALRSRSSCEQALADDLRRAGDRVLAMASRIHPSQRAEFSRQQLKTYQYQAQATYSGCLRLATPDSEIQKETKARKMEYQNCKSEQLSKNPAIKAQNELCAISAQSILEQCTKRYSDDIEMLMEIGSELADGIVTLARYWADEQGSDVNEKYDVLQGFTVGTKR